MSSIDPFPPAPDHDPDNKLQIRYDRPVQHVDTGKAFLETHPGPYARIVIQGDARYVEKIHAFLGIELDWMWDEIGRAKEVASARERFTEP